MKIHLFSAFLLLSLCFLQCTSPNQKQTVDSEQKETTPSIQSFDNTKIAYTDDGTGEVVLLIHGFISSGSSWNKTELKRQLLETGYRVIIPDLRGNGKSDKPQNAEAYKNDAEIKDLIALMDHLNIKSLKAVGHSRGSIVLAKLITKEVRITKAVFGGMGADFTDPQ